MKYRKLSSSGDYSFGRGNDSFYTDVPEAVAQAVQTRLTLFQDTFWRDLDDGLPVFQQIIGRPMGANHRQGVDEFIVERIKGTPGVTSLVDYESTFDPNTRRLSWQARIQTAYSETVLTGTL